jgi:signal transduction histidine kinase
MSAGATHLLNVLRRRHRLRGLLAAAVTLAGLAALVAAAFAVVILALGRPPTGAEWGILALSAGAAAACALLWVPLRERVAATAVRLLDGELDAPDEALRTLGARLTRALPLDELLLQLAETLRRTLALRAAEVWSGSDGVLERAASDPDRGGGTLILGAPEQSVVARAGVSGAGWAAMWLPELAAARDWATLRVAPVTNAGQLLGLIVVERDAASGPLDEKDDRLLADVARQLGLTLRNVHLDSALQASLDELHVQAAELRASRARVVSAADAERRRIERDLHDGAQQHLVGLVVNVRLARELADSDPAEAKRLLESIGAEAKDAVEQLRELAHGIYPPLLLDRGLAEPLRAAARHAVHAARVDATGLRRYSPEVEATVYFCCLEALQNAAKHAGPGATTTIRVWEELSGLRFAVSDDGGGFDPAAWRGDGTGLTNMRDRLGALGGRLAVDAAPGCGTSVTGTVPVGP